MSVWFESVLSGEKIKKQISLYFFPFLAKKEVIFTVLAQTITAASIKRCLYKSLVHISVNTDVRVSVFLQGGVIKEFLYLDRGCQSRKEEEEERKKGERKGKKGQEVWREEGKVSISLYLPGKYVECTKQMNRREEGMITTKMIIFNQNHDNNNK